VARRVIGAPRVHVDVGSRVDGFVAHVAAFRRILVIDIRPLTSRTANLEFVRADLMEPLREDLVDCCDSLSCLHALEHFGLGRYGDRIAYDGYLVALANLHRMLKQGGKLYLSVPIGPQRIEFNAHRVFSVAYLLECVQGRYDVDHFSFVDDRGDLHEHVLIRQADVDADYGCTYGCGILELTKR
jgi:SAM-dependent methyltransferase